MNAPGVNLTAGGALALLGVAVAGALAWRAYKAPPGSFDPTSRDNLAYRGVNGVGASIFTEPTDPGKNADGSWTLGGFVYDALHGMPDPLKDHAQPAIVLPDLSRTPDGAQFDAMGNRVN